MKVVIVGAGEVGFNIAKRLTFEDKNVVVVDKNEETLKHFVENIDVKIIVGSGSNPSILKHAGIEDAEVLLAVANSDEVNLASCMVADILSPSTKKLARIRSDSFIPYYESFRNNIPHIDTFINPDIEVVKTIESFMEVPGTVDDIVDFDGGNIKFVGVRINDISFLSGVKLADLPSVLNGIRPLIVALVRNEKLIIPRGKDILSLGDLAYFITEKEKLVETMSAFDPNNSSTVTKRVLIIGGGIIGYYLAKRLEARSISCKIIEKRVSRCEYLAQKLNRTVILHGNGSDQSLLREENIDTIDMVVTLTNDEETNVLTSLLAKRMGAKKTITQVSKFSSSFMSTIGIEQVVSSRLSAVNTILQHIRRGKILSAVSIKGEAGEIMEAVALPTSDIVSKPLRKMSFPKEAMVAGIMRRNKIIIPNGNSVIEPGDRIIVFAKREAISSVENALSVKLDYL